jgi:hypothetical protein
MDIQTKLSKFNGWQRLLTVIAALWVLLTFFLSMNMAQDDFTGKTSFLLFIGIFLLLNVPIWLTAVIIWILKGFKISSSGLKEKLNYIMQKIKSKMAQFSMANIRNSIFNLLKLGWQGKARLWKVYWLISFPFNIISKLIIDNFNASTTALSRGETISYLILFFLVMFCSVFLIAANWRCAFNVMNRGWGYIVRFQCIIGILIWGSALANFFTAIFH